MTTKIVYQTDADGYLIGPTKADESPLEPGVFLIPYCAVEDPPPGPADPGQEWRWSLDQWMQVPLREYTRPPTPEEKLAEFLRKNPDVQALINA